MSDPKHQPAEWKHVPKSPQKACDERVQKALAVARIVRSR